MRRGDGDEPARSSFNFRSSYQTGRSAGGPASDTKTEAQLLRLQRLVESLVVKELGRDDAPVDTGPLHEAQERRQPWQQQKYAAADALGNGHRSGRNANYNDSDNASYDMSVGPDGSASFEARYGSGAPSTATTSIGCGRREPRSPGWPAARAVNGSRRDGVQMQVAALQEQLATLGEQLEASYRAADQGVVVAVSSPRRAGRELVPPGNGGSGTGGIQGVMSPQRQNHNSAGGTSRASTAPGCVANAPCSPRQRKSHDTQGDCSGSSLNALRSRQGLDDRGSREDKRLRIWIQELREERRRLEDRLLDGDAGPAVVVQQLRDDLEKQVLNLSRQRDLLAAELNEMGACKAANTQLQGQVEALKASLAAETERVARYKEARPVIEGRLTEVVAALEVLRRQHAAAVEVLVHERDAALAKAKRSAKRVGELEVALDSSGTEVRRLQEEVRSLAMSREEARANSEVLQAASQQVQASMEAQAKETATRLAAIQAQLESSQSECTILRRQLETAQHSATVFRDQVKDMQARLDIQAAERERGVAALAEEQNAVAAARQQAEALAGQLRTSEEARADTARAAVAQLEAIHRQHAADIAATQKHYESQLLVAEKQYLLLQRQYDAGLASSDKAAETASSLRRERDALWAEAQNLKVELEDVRKEKADAVAKLTSLRADVRATLEEVAQERDARLAAATSQVDARVREAQTEAECRLSSLRQEYEGKLSNARDEVAKLRAESANSQRHTDKYRSMISHLKEQVRELLLSRDAAQRELTAERAFSEELNRLLAAMRSDQQPPPSSRD